jgi:enediyne biosynthesis protein E4
VTNNGESVDLLRNESIGGNALLVRTIGKQSNRDGVGAQLKVTTATQTQRREVRAGSSYLGQNDQRQHVGLGTATRVDRLEVRWPSGTTDVLQNIEANQIITVREGDGIISARRFTR